MEFVDTPGKKAPVNPGYLPVRSRTPFTESQRQALLEVVVSLQERVGGDISPNGHYLLLVKFNAIKEEFTELQRVCKEQGVELLRPNITTPGVSFMPFQKAKS